MPISELTSINPVILYWARETSGYGLDEAARRIGIKPDRLAEAEKATNILTLAQLRKAALTYKRPIDIFYLPEPPSPLPSPKDFRTIGNEIAQLSPKLRLEWRRALVKRGTALELFAEQDELPPDFEMSVKLGEPTENVAAQIAEWLGTVYSNRSRDLAPRTILNEWIRMIESRGVLVFQSSSFDIEEARGLSYWAEQLPFILLNGKDTPRARLFTLLHEFVHLLLRQAGAACNPLQVGARANPVEIFCNRVAAAIIIPKDLLLSLPTVQRYKATSEPWSDSDIQTLTTLFGCSREVLLLRLLSLDLVSNIFVDMKFAGYEIEYEQFRRNAASKKKSGGPPPFRMTMRDNGGRFCRLVFAAIDRNLISEIDAANYLGLRPSHFDDARYALARNEVLA